MFGKLIAKAILIAAAIAMAFFGIGLLGRALARLLALTLGPIGGFALAGAILLVPPLIWALVLFARPKKRPEAANNELTKVLLASVAKETPWIAIIGAGLASAANIFLNRYKSRK